MHFRYVAGFETASMNVSQQFNALPLYLLSTMISSYFDFSNRRQEAAVGMLEVADRVTTAVMGERVWTERLVKIRELTLGPRARCRSRG